MNVQQIAIEIDTLRSAKREIEEAQGKLVYLCEGITSENALQIRSSYRGVVSIIEDENLSSHEKLIIESLKAMLKDEIARLTETCTKAESNIKELAK